MILKKILDLLILLPLHQYWYVWLLRAIAIKSRTVLVKKLVTAAALVFIIYILSSYGNESQLIGVVVQYFILFLVISQLHLKYERKPILRINEIALYLWAVYIFQVAFTDTYLLLFEELTWSGNYELLRNSISEYKSITVFGAHNYAAAAYFIIFSAEYLSKKKLTAASISILILLVLTKSWSGMFYGAACILIILNNVKVKNKNFKNLLFAAFTIISLPLIFWFRDYMLGDEANGIIARMHVDSSFLLGVQLLINNGFSLSGFAPGQFTDSGVIIYLWRFGVILGSALTIYIWYKTKKILGTFSATIIALQNIFLPIYSSIQIMSLILLMKGVMDDKQQIKK